MANTLTSLINYIFDTADVVSREMVGMIPSVYLNGKAEQVAKDQNITYPIVPAAAASDVTPAATVPALADTAYGTGTMAITKVRKHAFHWTGDDEASISPDMKNILQNNKFAQAFRVLTNEMESDLGALYVSASRAYGTAGTTPFATAGDFSDAAEVVRILKDNGAPIGDLQLVINTAAGAKLIGKQSRADIMGGNIGSLQQQGVLFDIAGCKMRESAAIKAHTKGTGASYTSNTAGYAVGATSITLITGTGTVLAGDVVTFAGDTNKYIVKTGVAAPGAIVLAEPGLKVALAASAVAMTIGNSSAENMSFDRSAIHLLSRLPKVPSEGDLATDEYVMVDPNSGIPFRIALYKGYHANQIEVSTAWGVKAVKPEHMAILLG